MDRYWARLVFIVPCLFHAIGFILLLIVRRESKDYFHYWLLTSLSVSECLFSLSFLVRYLFESHYDVLYYTILISDAGIIIFIDLIMQLIVINRFLEIYVNIRYPTFWNVRKTKIAILICFILSLTTAVVLRFVKGKRLEALFPVLSLYLYPILSLVFLVSATITYGYIMKKIYWARKSQIIQLSSPPPSTSKEETTGIENEHDADRPVKRPSKSRPKSGLLLPTLLIVTYLVFRVAPVIFFFHHAVEGKFPTNLELMLTQGLVFLSLMSDVLIYVLIFPPIRNWLWKKVCNKTFCSA